MDRQLKLVRLGLPGSPRSGRDADQQAACVCEVLGHQMEQGRRPGRDARAWTQQGDVRRGDHQRLGLGRPSGTRSGWARSAGSKRRDAGLRGRARCRRQAGLALRQPDPGQQADLGLIADRQAFGDEDRAAHAPAERAADGHLERTEDRARDAFPDIDLALPDRARGQRAACSPPTRLISAYQLISAPASSGSSSRGGTEYTGEPKGVATPGSGSPSSSRGRACASTGCERPPSRPTACTFSSETRRSRQPSQPNGTAGSTICPGCPVNCKFPVGRVHDPDLAPGQRHGTGKPSAVFGEEQNRVGLVDDPEFGGEVLAAGERDENRAHRPVERVGGLRCRLGRAHPHGPALH